VTLEVAVLDQRERCVGGPGQVVDPDLDVPVEDAREVGVRVSAPHRRHTEGGPAERGGQHGAEEHADRRLAAQDRVVEGQTGDQQGDGEPDPRQRGATDQVTGCHALRERAGAEPDRQ
jgi:hypothetical protein